MCLEAGNTTTRYSGPAITSNKMDLCKSTKFLLTLLLLMCIRICSVKSEESPQPISFCPQLKNCTCNERINSLALIKCVNLSDIDSLARAIHEDFKNVTLNEMKLTNCTFSNVPSLFLSNVSLSTLYIERVPVTDINDDAFRDSIGFTNFRIEGALLQAIPYTLRYSTGLVLLSLSMNQITSVNQELKPLTNLRRLYLKRNRISQIAEDALESLNFLQVVDLSENFLEAVPDKMFQKTLALEELRLNNNRLKRIGNILENLHSLTIVYFSNNSLEDVSELSSSNYKISRELRLDFNPIQHIPIFSTGIGSLKNTLAIRGCNITQIPQGAFAFLRSLRSLQLSQNRLSHVSPDIFISSTLQITQLLLNDNNLTDLMLLSPLKTLRHLEVQYNNVRDLGRSLYGLTDLSFFDISFNSLEYIEDFVFVNNEILATLVVSHNQIAWIGKNAFQNLRSLKYFDLKHNKIVSLNGSLVAVPALTFVILNGNNISQITQNELSGNSVLKYVSLAGNQLASVDRVFTNNLRLKGLYLEGNNLSTFSRESLPPNLRNLKKLKLSENPLTCDCRLYWVIRIQKYLRQMDKPTCAGPVWLRGKILTHLKEEDITRWPKNCPTKCSCNCIKTNTSTFSVDTDCSSKELTSIPSVIPESTKILHLDGNALSTASGSGLLTSNKLDVVLLNNSKIRSMDGLKFPESLSYLDVSYNNLARFSLDAVKSLNLTDVGLAYNPWICDCEAFKFRQWAQAHKTIIMDSAHVRCSLNTSYLNAGRPLLNLNQTDMCPPVLALYIILITSMLSVLFVFASSAALYLKMERRLKIWMYANGICARLNCVKEDEIDQDKMFDVFVSFSSKDLSFVVRELEPGLEKGTPSFSVCTYYKNFKGGYPLAQAIQEAVKVSRRTIIVLSKNFVESEWCSWEFKVAHQKALEDKVNRLVVVVHEELPSVDKMDEELCLYLQSTNYLRWGESNFWPKLRYSLPKKIFRPGDTSLPSEEDRCPLIDA